LIVPLGRWVLGEACRQLRVWRADPRIDPALILNVNVSARQLQQRDLTASVRQTLEAHDLHPHSLTLEITESCLMQDSDAGQLRQLAALGVNLAIDDFGTGYSSLAYLSRLPIDTLKIDRSFVARLGQEPESTALVQTIIALAQALGLSVTAEGIEHAGQAAHLQALHPRPGFPVRPPRPRRRAHLQPSCTRAPRRLAPNAQPELNRQLRAADAKSRRMRHRPGLVWRRMRS
jgi:EAL domain-containing protein (putative c-di-GMP-specific phosphodiesterase class I)